MEQVVVSGGGREKFQVRAGASAESNRCWWGEKIRNIGGRGFGRNRNPLKLGRECILRTKTAASQKHWNEKKTKFLNDHNGRGSQGGIPEERGDTVERAGV